MASRNRAAVREAIHKRIRRKVRGTTERPRLAVYRSVNHIYAQLIDDEKARTLAAASTTEKSLRGPSGGNIEAAKRVGVVCFHPLFHPRVRWNSERKPVRAWTASRVTAL